MMSDSGLFRAAKQATDSVAAKASDLAQSATGTSGALADLASGVKDQLLDATTEVKETGFAKLGEALADFNAALPVLREAGYVLEGVTIKLGLVPQVSANFSAGTAVPEERVEALLAEHAGRKLTALIVRSVYNATKLQSKLKISGMRPSGLSVEIGLSPQVTVNFSPTAEDAALAAVK
jgi:hypothetical protein